MNIAGPTACAGPSSSLRMRLSPSLEILGRFPLSILQLLFRLAIAAVFLKADVNKAMSWELTIQLFADEYRVPMLPPEVAATLATTFEIGCSLLLLVGLFTRLATLPLLAQILVIQLFVYPNA